MQLCSIASSDAVGIVHVAGDESYVLLSTGSVYFCNGAGGGSASLLISPPSGSNDGFNAIAGQGKDLFMSAYNGFYYCKGVTPASSGTCSSFINYPSSYCSSTPAGFCSPAGIAVDKNLNLYFTDSYNDLDAMCSASSSYTSCGTLFSLGDPEQYTPTGLTIDTSGNLWTTDGGFNGYIWENGNVLTTICSPTCVSLVAITWTKATLYVAGGNSIYKVSIATGTSKTLISGLSAQVTGVYIHGKDLQYTLSSGSAWQIIV